MAKRDGNSIQAIIRKTLKSQIVVGETIPPTDFISTGVPSVDHALGRPGIACGRLTVIRGAPSVGKSSLLYYLMAETQRRGGLAILFETELGIERERLEQFGIIWDDLIVVQPDCVEETLNKIEKTVEAVRENDEDILCLIGWDSVAATPTRRELDEDNDTVSVGAHSRVIGRGLRKLTALIARHKIAFVIVNQFREKVGGMPFADNKTMLADNPLRFHASMIIDATQVGVIRTAKGTDPIGADIQFDISKNKLASPRRRVQVPFYYKTGFDIGQSWLDMAEKTAVVKKTGAWYTFPDGSKLQRSAACMAILGDLDMQAKVRQVIETGEIAIDNEDEDDE